MLHRTSEDYGVNVRLYRTLLRIAQWIDFRLKRNLREAGPSIELMAHSTARQGPAPITPASADTAFAYTLARKPMTDLMR
jgi:hypothetical protein